MTTNLNIMQFLDELLDSKEKIDFKYLLLRIKNEIENNQFSNILESDKLLKPGYVELFGNSERNAKLNLFEPNIYDILELENLIDKERIKEIGLCFKNNKLSEDMEINAYTEYSIKNKELFKREKIVINKKLSEVELNTLKNYIEVNKNSVIELDFQNIEQYREILTLFENIKLEIALNPQFRKEDFVFFSQIKNQISFFKSFFVFEEKNLSVEAEREMINVDNLIKKEDILFLITQEIKKQDLTPFENYLYIYNIVKNFKRYKLEDIDDNIWFSRNTVYTLFNEYICCAGYANLVEEIVDHLDDSNLKASTFVLTVLVNNNKVNHERNLIRIVDEKYNIDGIFTSDSTFDSMDHYNEIAKDLGFQLDIDLSTKDIYTHFLLTQDEVEDERIIDITYSESDILFEFISYFDVLFPQLAPKIVGIINKLYGTNYQHFRDIDFWPISQQEISKDKISAAIRVIYEKIYCIEKEKIDKLLEECLETNDILAKFTFNTKNYKFDLKQRKI